MDVVRILELGEVRRDSGKQVIRGDAVLRHTLGRDFILIHNRSRRLLLGWIIRDRRGARPDDLGSGFLKPFDDLLQAFGIIRRRGCPIMDTEIEMDDIPLPFAEPSIEILQS